MPDTHPEAIAPAPPRPLIGWRLLALFYDLWPSLALWMLASLCFTLGYTIAGHHDPHENIAPLSGLQWLLWITCWLLAGLYARSEEHPSEPQSLNRHPYAVFRL